MSIYPFFRYEKKFSTPSQRLARKRSEDQQMVLRQINDNSTPKKIKPSTENCATPIMSMMTTRRKSILKMQNTPSKGTPNRKIQFSEQTENLHDNIALATSKPERRPSLAAINERTPVKTPNKTSAADEIKTPKSASKLKMLRDGHLTPSLAEKEINSSRRKSDVQVMREKLHVSAAPDSLPCRETEYSNIYSFLEGKINDQSGG